MFYPSHGHVDALLGHPLRLFGWGELRRNLTTRRWRGSALEFVSDCRVGLLWIRRLISSVDGRPVFLALHHFGQVRPQLLLHYRPLRGNFLTRLLELQRA